MNIFTRLCSDHRPLSERTRRRQHHRRWSDSRGKCVAAETLEIRQLLTAVSMTDQEQLLLELVNRARLNPTAEATRYGISLNAGLPSGTISTDPKQPLAPHQSLVNAAGLHSQDMLNRDFFAHENPEGLDAADRGRNAGYPTSAIGENIVYSGSTGAINQNALVHVVHEDLFHSPGHRQNMLHPPYEEVGMGVRYGVFTTEGNNFNVLMATENFGIRNVNPFITGVVYTDLDSNNFYSIGEAIRSGTVTATATTGGLTYTANIGNSGGYGMIVPSGTYNVASNFQLSGTWYRAEQTVTVGTSNVKVDFKSGNATAAGLSLSLSNSAMTETGTSSSSTLTVTRSGSTAGSLLVTLTSNDTSEATVPGSVTIPAGQASAQVTVAAVADGIIDGTQSVSITAAATGYSASVTSLTVADTTVPWFTQTIVDTNLSRPVIAWNGVSNASTYVLWVNNDSTGQNQFLYHEGLTSTSLTPSADMPVGMYRIWVRGINAAGQSSGWSAAQRLRIKTPPTVNGNYSTVATSSPTITWNTVPGAATWDMWVDQISTSTQQYYRNTAVTENALTLTGLGAGRYGIWVRPVNSAGFAGNWSARSHITVSLPPANVAVTASDFSAPVTITWDPLPGVATYHVWVNNQSTGASAVVSQSGISTASHQLPALPAGSYAVWVRGVDGLGFGYAWSPVVQFELQQAPRRLSPAWTTNSQTPLIAWTQVAGASRYELWVSSLDGAGRVIHDTTLTTNSYIPGSNLAAGRYRIWIRAFDSSNAFTGWSASYDFTIAQSQQHDLDPNSTLLENLFSNLANDSSEEWSLLEFAENEQSSEGKAEVVFWPRRFDDNIGTAANRRLSSTKTTDEQTRTESLAGVTIESANPWAPEMIPIVSGMMQLPPFQSES